MAETQDKLTVKEVRAMLAEGGVSLETKQAWIDRFERLADKCGPNARADLRDLDSERDFRDLILEIRRSDPVLAAEIGEEVGLDEVQHLGVGQRFKFNGVVFEVVDNGKEVAQQPTPDVVSEPEPVDNADVQGAPGEAEFEADVSLAAVGISPRALGVLHDQGCKTVGDAAEWLREVGDPTSISGMGPATVAKLRAATGVHE